MFEERRKSIDLQADIFSDQLAHMKDDIPIWSQSEQSDVFSPQNEVASKQKVILFCIEPSEGQNSVYDKIDSCLDSPDYQSKNSSSKYGNDSRKAYASYNRGKSPMKKASPVDQDLKFIEKRIISNLISKRNNPEEKERAEKEYQIKAEIAEQRRQSSSKNNIFYQNLLCSNENAKFCLPSNTLKQLVKLGSIKTPSILVLGDAQKSGPKSKAKQVSFSSNKIIIEYPK